MRYVYTQVQKSEHAAVSVQLLDLVSASVSANVMESEHATINVKILGSTDTTVYNIKFKRRMHGYSG